MMAKHKIDSLVHTREVVSEIQHLTKMLNFKDMSRTDDGTSIWCNINWGDNAPYWNQYYKIVRDYNYPFEVKSEECRILDLISEEINRLIDMEYRDKAPTYADKFEIPIETLMDVVKHITDDTIKVKDLLEWNGYEIQDNVVIHSRLVVDHLSVTSGEEEWPEFDTESDCETTDLRSTTLSDGSTIAPDFHGRGLRRALDKKVRGLRAMLSADEDISTELDHVVCRLMKLALFTCKGKQTAPPTKWMQCKLLDLLTLTEKAIARRKRHCLENYSFKAIGFGDSTCQEGNGSALAIDKMKEDNMNVRKIVDKYFHIIESENIDDYNTFKYRYDDDVLTRDIASNATLKDFEFSDMNFSQTLDHNFEFTEKISEDDSCRGRSRARLGKDALEVVSYPVHNLHPAISPSDYSTSNGEIRRYKKINKRLNTCSRIQEDKKTHKRSHSDETKHESRSKRKRSKTNLKNISNSFIKNCKKKIATSHFGNYGLKTKRKIKERKNLQSTSSKPIPGSLIELCHPDLRIKVNSNSHHCTKDKRRKERIDTVNNLSSDIAATEESVLIDIVMDDMEETIALRRSIGTDAVSPLNKETGLRKIDHEVKDVALDSELQVKTENVHSQTIFLYDINEPSTSKGVRHVSMDVQCCTDSTTPYPRPSPVSSLTRPTQMFGTGIKIDDSLTNIGMKKVNHADSSVATSNVVPNFGPTSLRIRSTGRNLKGIKIEDSFTNMTVRKSSDFGTCTNDDNYENLFTYPTFRSPTRRSVGIKIKDSVSDLRNVSHFGTSTDEHEDISKKMSPRTKFPSKRTKGITIRDSYTDICTGQHFDFGTATNNAIEQHKTTNTEQKSPEPYNGVQMKSTFDHDVPGRSDSLFKMNTNSVLESGGNTVNNDMTSENASKVSLSKMQSRFSQTNFTKNTNTGTTPEYPRYYGGMRKSPKAKFTKGINSTDYLTAAGKISPNMTGHIINSRSPSPVNRSFGFKIKSDDGNITKCVEWSSTRIELSDFHTPVLLPLHPNSTTESKLTDSGSEYYESCCCSSPKRNLYLTNSAINTSDAQPKGLFSEVIVEKKLSPSKLLRNNLSCGGVQIHSYKEKQVSEDIVFQGEWQRHNPKLSRDKVKKKPMYSSVTKNLYTEISNKKRNTLAIDKPYLKKFEQNPQVKTEIKKPAQFRSKFKSKQETATKTEQMKKTDLPKNLGRTITNKNILKVASKVTVNSITSKTTRNMRSSKRLVKQPPKNHIAFGRGSTTYKDPKAHLIPTHTKKHHIMDKSKLNQSLGTIETIIEINKGKPRKAISSLRRSKTEIKTELMKMSNDIRENLTYVVFRNELENNHKKTTNNEPIDNVNKTEGTSRRRNVNRRSSSPISQNSSTCSTPDSIATVKETRNKPSARRHYGHSPSSNKSSLCNSDTDPISPVRNKKFKRCKSGKMSEDKGNKENIAESSKKQKSNENLQTVKNAFMGRSKNIYLAQVANESALTLNSKHQIPNKSIIRTVDSSDEKRKRGSSSTIMKKSVVQDTSIRGINEKQVEFTSEPSNVVFVVGPLEKLESNAPQCAAADNDDAIVNIVDNTLLAEWLGKRSNSGLDRDSTESTILAAMKQIVEDRLDFITTPLDMNELTNMDTQIHEDGIEQELDETSSLKSFQTVITKGDNTDYSETQNITDIAFNTSFESAQDLPSTMSIDYQTDYDLVSFKSSTSASRISGYFLTDDFSNTLESDNMPLEIRNISSVRDIFERKEYISPKPPGMLAVQAFSGFSMDAEPVAGDQPDYVNLVGSDAGSLAVDVTRQAASGGFAKFADSLIRQKPDPVHNVDSETGCGASVARTTRINKSCEKYNASVSQRPDPINAVDSETGSILKSLIRRATSEELFISGRSSESYESCIIDEDAVVPNWLFNIINQQYSIDIEEDQPIEGPLPTPPHTEPVYDLNGNVPEPGMGVGAGAGAGDGRGMHSDHSQDSSGRGTSLSSSDASSGQQSEAILIDPSAFTAQFELLHDSIGSSAGVTTLVLPIDGSRSENADNEILSTSRTTRILVNPLLAVSDGEADVSSLDTDAPDSSDN